MEQPVQKSRMPKGCVIALIIVGALAVLLVIVLGLICMNRDKVLKWSTREGITYYKSQLAAKPVEGIDTVQFDRLADSFLVRLQAEKVTDTALARFATTFQSTIMDKQISKEDVYRMSDAMISVFPDMAPMGLKESGPGEASPAENPALPDTGRVRDSLTRDTLTR